MRAATNLKTPKPKVTVTVPEQFNFIEGIVTPVWASKELPEDVELIRVKGHWYIIFWDENNVSARHAPEKWAFAGKLNKDTRTEQWIPPTRFVGRCIKQWYIDPPQKDAEPDQEADAEPNH